ncbi:4-alpha-glucanotransferase [Palleronia sp. LCG004]|uniref:4-alpha-glucanotransferase n=1 Tax=Palleronia sp. LCG004 TaxID=3079304 RepID=UPI002941E15E|nr:4-alpha-glucanotransferase [Palleronia sp. LCG004]WOI54915.1 4-alpha-glucanotransferase [Palleronia sp. LCG004]
MSDPRDRLAARLGVVRTYTDQIGKTHELTPETRDAILAAMGVPPGAEAAEDHLARIEAEDSRRPVGEYMVLSSEWPERVAALDGHDWEMTFEDGTTRQGHGADLGQLPMGMHRIAGDGWSSPIVAARPRLDPPPKSWGVTLPLYGLGAKGRIGTYDDLRAAMRSLGQSGADFVGINPIHAGFLGDPTAISPYSPSHRGRLSAVHIGPADAPEAPGGEFVDYRATQPDRLAALAREWDADDPDFTAWRDRQDEELERFALHQALSEELGSYWPDWPEPYRDPRSEEVANFARDHAERIGFHAWLQWRAESELDAVQRAADEAGMRFGLYLDLAVGTHPAGAETWADPDLFASGVSLGAPPDAFSARGQSWGLAPLRPDTLIARGFAPLAAILRQQLAHARLLRIDHILGFERAFWAPQNREIPGAYVSMPRDALLAVARIEAARAGATIVGEDLGNIPDGLHDALSGAGIFGCRVAQFEQDWNAATATFIPAEGYSESALTSFGTHDLPTWEGWKAGRDLEWRRDIGDTDQAQFEDGRAQRREEVAALTTLIGGTDAYDLHAFLARTPSRLIAVQIEDLLGRVEQPNLPGTVDEHPNWRRTIGVAPERLGELDAVVSTASLMRDAGR